MQAPAAPPAAVEQRVPPSQLVLADVTPATRLLEKRRQQFELDEALEGAKKEQEGKEEAFRQREEGLKRRDLELQESLLRFTRFLQENDAKRAKAARRATEEARLRQEKEAEILQLHAEAEQCAGAREAAQQQLQRMVRYQHYLQAVAEVGESFQESEDILARHATLQAAAADLREQQAAASAEAERVRGATAALASASADELMALHNRVSLLRRELEAAQQEAAALEAGQERGLALAAQRALEQGQVVMSAASLYQRCLRHSRVAHPADEPSPLAQLEVVAHFSGDLREVLRLHQQQQTTAVAEAAATSAG